MKNIKLIALSVILSCSTSYSNDEIKEVKKNPIKITYNEKDKTFSGGFFEKIEVYAKKLGEEHRDKKQQYKKELESIKEELNKKLSDREKFDIESKKEFLEKEKEKTDELFEAFSGMPNSISILLKKPELFKSHFYSTSFFNGEKFNLIFNIFEYEQIKGNNPSINLEKETIKSLKEMNLIAKLLNKKMNKHMYNKDYKMQYGKNLRKIENKTTSYQYNFIEIICKELNAKREKVTNICKNVSYEEMLVSKHKSDETRIYFDLHQDIALFFKTLSKEVNEKNHEDFKKYYESN